MSTKELIFQGSSDITIEGMGLEVLEAEDYGDAHPNRLPFSGVLTRIDEPSTRPPSGADGHRVMIPRAVAEAALSSLIGMGVGATHSLKAHDPQHKIGIITHAWIEGRDLRVKGFMFAKDFPSDVERIRAQSQMGSLGMSFEVTHVQVADVRKPVWELTALTFTGAAILTRKGAAYENTSLIAAQAEVTPMEVRKMAVDVLAAMDELKNVFKRLAAELEDTEEVDASKETEDVDASDNEGVLAMGDSEVHGMMKRLAGMGPDKVHAMVKRLAAMDQQKACGEMKKMGNVDAESMDKKDMEDDKEDDDKKEEKAMGNMKKTHAEADQRLDNIEKAIEQMAEMQAKTAQLLSDMQTTQKKLLTDQTAQGTQLRTDTQLGDNLNGGPARKTFTANGEYPDFLSKYGLEKDRSYTERELSEVLEAAGADTTQRLAAKIEYDRRGLLAHN